MHTTGFSDAEVAALSLARELSERVQRERDSVRKLKDYLAGQD